MQIEQGQLDKTFVIDWEPLLTPYVDAVIEGMKEADPENAFDQDKRKSRYLILFRLHFVRMKIMRKNH